jgi:hypothetical protein
MFIICTCFIDIFLQLLSEEILRILNTHDQQDPTVHHQAMVLTKNILETNRFAKQLNATAKQEIAASYTGETKNSDNILRQFENGKNK